MTNMQKKTVERINAYVFERDLHNGNTNYELKRFDVEQIEHGLVRVYSIAGRKNDEDSILRFCSRKRRKIIIGPRGGITAFIRVKGKENEKVFRGWQKAMSLGYDQQPHDFPSHN